MSLSPTAYVILGTLGWRPMSGYEIKSIVDKSTRFFWAASYGQIYPELRRLADAGLLAASDAPRGGVRRTEYHLTAEGERVLKEWLTGDDFGIFEIRDELLLRFFFGDAVSSESLAMNQSSCGEPTGHPRACHSSNALRRIRSSLIEAFISAI